MKYSMKLKEKGYIDQREIFAICKTKAPKEVSKEASNVGVLFGAIGAMLVFLFNLGIRRSKGNLKLPTKVCIAINRNKISFLKSTLFNKTKLVKEMRIKSFKVDSVDEVYEANIYLLKVITLQNETFTFTAYARGKRGELLSTFIEQAQAR